jgi:hypothetical protein
MASIVNGRSVCVSRVAQRNASILSVRRRHRRSNRLKVKNQRHQGTAIVRHGGNDRLAWTPAARRGGPFGRGQRHGPHTAFAPVRRNALRLLRPTGLRAPLSRGMTTRNSFVSGRAPEPVPLVIPHSDDMGPPAARKHPDWPLLRKAAVAADVLRRPPVTPSGREVKPKRTLRPFQGIPEIGMAPCLSAAQLLLATLVF